MKEDKKEFSKEDFIDKISLFKNQKILVLGDIFLDRFTWGSIERTNPEQPAAPLVKREKDSYVLGGAANVANSIVSLGAKCSLYGIIGDDSHGNKIKELCNDSGINLFPFISSKSTIVKQRIMAHNQQVARIDYGEENLNSSEPNLISVRNEIINDLIEKINSFDFVILSDYNKTFFDDKLTKKIIETANKFKIQTLADPKPKNIDFFTGCTIVSPNQKEAEEITKIKYSKENLFNMAKILSRLVKTKYVTITCGGDGTYSYYNGNSKFIEPKAKRVVDVTGAGDTFASTISLCLSLGIPIYNSVEIANYAAGIVVGKPGTQTVSAEELINSLNS